MCINQMFRRILKLICLSWYERFLLLEAFILTGIFRFAILFIAFNKIAKLSGKYKGESSQYVSDIEKVTINKIAWAVAIISLHTPWESKCLVKALTAQLMLTKRKISSTLYLGVAKDEEKKLIAHAWLRSGTEVITGYEARNRFVDVVKFANN
jgi:hypothetical protein